MELTTIADDFPAFHDGATVRRYPDDFRGQTESAGGRWIEVDGITVGPLDAVITTDDAVGDERSALVSVDDRCLVFSERRR